MMMMMMMMSNSHLFYTLFILPFTAVCIEGIISAPPSASMRRQLVIISKVLQNISSHVTFGTKEDFMTIMNDFVSENAGMCLSYYEKLLCVCREFRFSLSK